VTIRAALPLEAARPASRPRL